VEIKDMKTSPDFFTKVFDCISDGILIVDLEGRVLGSNRAMRKLLGKPEGEPLRGHCWELVHATESRIEDCPFLLAIASGRRESLTFRHGDRWLRAIVDPLPDQSGHITQAVHIITDITEQKEAEAALEERLRLASLMAEVGQAITQSGAVSTILQQCAELLVRHLNAAFARVWTFTPAEEMLELQASAGRYTHLDGPHARIPLSRKVKIANIGRTRQPHLTNAVIGDPEVSDQEWAQREGMTAFAGYPLIVQDRLIGVMGLFAQHHLSDAVLTTLGGVADEVALSIDHHRSCDLMSINENRLKSLIEHIPNIVVALTPAHRITEFNPEAERLYGRTREEVLGQDYFKLFLPESLWESVDEQIQKVMMGERSRGHTNAVIGKGGEEFIISWDANPLLDATGRPTGVVAIGQDVTARKNAEKRDALRFAITTVLAESTTMIDAAPQLLQTLCQELAFDLGELWLEDESSQALRLASFWADPSLEAGEFLQTSRELNFSSGQGLPGLVWSRKEPIWLPDVLSSPVFQRLPQAKTAGLRAACGVPVTLGREVKGVIPLS
jgi:PAS domain S-box-containing protein